MTGSSYVVIINTEGRVGIKLSQTKTKNNLFVSEVDEGRADSSIQVGDIYHSDCMDLAVVSKAISNAKRPLSLKFTRPTLRSTDLRSLYEDSLIFNLFVGHIERSDLSLETKWASAKKQKALRVISLWLDCCLISTRNQSLTTACIQTPLHLVQQAQLLFDGGAEISIEGILQQCYEFLQPLLDSFSSTSRWISGFLFGSETLPHADLFHFVTSPGKTGLDEHMAAKEKQRQLACAVLYIFAHSVSITSLFPENLHEILCRLRGSALYEELLRELITVGDNSSGNSKGSISNLLRGGSLKIPNSLLFIRSNFGNENLITSASELSTAMEQHSSTSCWIIPFDTSDPMIAEQIHENQRHVHLIHPKIQPSTETTQASNYSGESEGIYPLNNDYQANSTDCSCKNCILDIEFCKALTKSYLVPDSRRTIPLTSAKFRSSTCQSSSTNSLTSLSDSSYPTSISRSKYDIFEFSQSRLISFLHPGITSQAQGEKLYGASLVLYKRKKCSSSRDLSPLSPTSSVCSSVDEYTPTLTTTFNMKSLTHDECHDTYDQINTTITKDQSQSSKSILTVALKFVNLSKPLSVGVPSWDSLHQGKELLKSKLFSKSHQPSSSRQTHASEMASESKQISSAYDSNDIESSEDEIIEMKIDSHSVEIPSTTVTSSHQRTGKDSLQSKSSSEITTLGTENIELDIDGVNHQSSTKEMSDTQACELDIQNEGKGAEDDDHKIDTVLEDLKLIIPTDASASLISDDSPTESSTTIASSIALPNSPIRFGESPIPCDEEEGTKVRADDENKQEDEDVLYACGITILTPLCAIESLRMVLNEHLTKLHAHLFDVRISSEAQAWTKIRLNLDGNDEKMGNCTSEISPLSPTSKDFNWILHDECALLKLEDRLVRKLQQPHLWRQPILEYDSEYGHFSSENDVQFDFEPGIFFDQISPRNIALIIHASLLGIKVIAVSEGSSSAFFCFCEWIKAAIHPLPLSSIILPLLNNDLAKDILTCPVPFLIGVSKETYDYLSMNGLVPDDVMVMDLELDLIQIPQIFKGAVLQGANNLALDINRAIRPDFFSSDKPTRPYGLLSGRSRANIALSKCRSFSENLSNLCLRNCVKFIDTDGSSLIFLDTIKVLEENNRSNCVRFDHKFLETFMQTSPSILELISISRFP